MSRTKRVKVVPTITLRQVAQYLQKHYNTWASIARNRLGSGWAAHGKFVTGGCIIYVPGVKRDGLFGAEMMSYIEMMKGVVAAPHAPKTKRV